MSPLYVPNGSELAALRTYAAEHGRKWRAALLVDWYHARRPGELQALRNHPNFGPEGLRLFRLPGEAWTFVDARDACRAEGYTLTRKPDREFRLCVQGGTEDQAYYTQDLGDAVDTARAEAIRRNAAAQVRAIWGGAS